MPALFIPIVKYFNIMSAASIRFAIPDTCGALFSESIFSYESYTLIAENNRAVLMDMKYREFITRSIFVLSERSDAAPNMASTTRAVAADTLNDHLVFSAPWR